MAQALPVAADCCSPCSSCSITISTSGAGGGSTLVVKSLAEARVIDSVTAENSQFLVVNGFITGGDGFLGQFVWDAVSTAIDDSSNILEPDDSPALGRWIRQV